MARNNKSFLAFLGFLLLLLTQIGKGKVRKKKLQGVTAQSQIANVSVEKSMGCCGS